MAIDLLNVGLSLLSGAGGALLLEVWWKPRHARKRAAVLLRAEIQETATSYKRGCRRWTSGRAFGATSFSRKSRRMRPSVTSATSRCRSRSGDPSLSRVPDDSAGLPASGRGVLRNGGAEGAGGAPDEQLPRCPAGVGGAHAVGAAGLRCGVASATAGGGVIALARSSAPTLGRRQKPVNGIEHRRAPGAR
jgi:hypothetical protein